MDYTETCHWQGKRGEENVKKHFSWVTDILLIHPQSSMDIFEVMRGGRARWHIENNAFKALTVEGYNFKHNFGHGKKNLSYVVVLLMMLQLVIDQMAQLKDSVFQKAKSLYRSKSSFYDDIRAAYKFARIKGRQHLFNLLIRKSYPDTS